MTLLRFTAPMVHVKICGVTTPEEARACVELGASSIGVNLVPSSVRRVDPATALAIARAVHSVPSRAPGGTRVIVVGVVADLTLDAMRAVVVDAELDCLQLHGDEPKETLAALLPHAYKAMRIAAAADVERARTYGGGYILVDAKVEGSLGGTGATFDWGLVAALARERRLALAGGLDAGNVARAVREVRPFCVDVASGVERAPGAKDLAKVRAFIDAAHGA